MQTRRKWGLLLFVHQTTVDLGARDRGWGVLAGDRGWVLTGTQIIRIWRLFVPVSCPHRSLASDWFQNVRSDRLPRWRGAITTCRRSSNRTVQVVGRPERRRRLSVYFWWRHSGRPEARGRQGRGRMYKQRKWRQSRVHVSRARHVYWCPVGPPHCVISTSGSRPEVAMVGA